MGSLTHSLLLHGEKYQTQLTVFADGYSFRLMDLYNRPQLFVRYLTFRYSLNIRTPDDDNEILYEWDDDPYLSEIEAFIEDVEGHDGRGKVLSSFEDAVRTYELTWAIREASEQR